MWLVTAIVVRWSDLQMDVFVLCSNVINIVSTNISPRVQKEIIGFISENVGKHRQYIGKIKNTKMQKITIYSKKSANIAIKSIKSTNIAIYSKKIGKYCDKIGKKSPKNWGKYRGDILPIDRYWVSIARYCDVADISAMFVTLVCRSSIPLFIALIGVNSVSVSSLRVLVFGVQICLLCIEKLIASKILQSMAQGQSTQCQRPCRDSLFRLQWKTSKGSKLKQKIFLLGLRPP